MTREWIDFKGIYGGIEGARAKFEEACEALFRKKYPNEFVQIVKANPGDEGIDILVGNIGKSPIKVYQCKFFLEPIKSIQKTQIKDSFKTAINSTEFEMSEWILCIPQVFDISANKWWVDWKEEERAKNNLKITFKNGNELIELMKEFNVYNSFFHVQTNTMIEQIHKAVVNNAPLHMQVPIYNFSNDLKEWFGVLNYSIEKQLSEDNSSFQWIINVPKRRGFDRIYIMGLCEEASLHHISILDSRINEFKCDEGWIISTRRISQAAKDKIQNDNSTNIYCYTFDELIDNDADFTGYINWFENLINEKGIDRKYIPLDCKKDEFDLATQKKLGISTYDAKNGGIDGYIDRWLDDPSKKHISILGEFGTGKTWFSQHYAWHLIKIYKEAKRKGITRPRLPLFIPLRDYAKAVSVESLFSEFFFRKHEIPIPGYRVFMQLNKMGKLLLIFDGFDEMADKIDRQKMINNFWELAKIVTDNSKVLLTCRNEHFPDAKEGRTLLNAELKASVANLTGEPPQFETLELKKLNDKQIRQLLSLHTTIDIVNLIMSNKKLLDLARRPVMTELIIESLPEIEEGRLLDMSRIYLYAVTRKMKRDIKEQRTFTSLADKLYFMCELSWEMLITDTMSINYKLIPHRIRSLFGANVIEQKDLDHWHYDMMGQTMLIRNEEGDYSPAHRSLIEFFGSYKLAAILGILNDDFLEIAKDKSNIDNSLPAEIYSWSSYFSYQSSKKRRPPLNYFENENLDELIQIFGQIPLTVAMIDLMMNMISIDDDDTQNLLLEIIHACKKKEFKEVRYAATNAVTILLNHSPNFFKGKDLSYLSLQTLGENIRYAVLKQGGFNFSATDFSYSDLSWAEFDHAILDKAIMIGTNLTYAEFNLGHFNDIIVLPDNNLIAGYNYLDLVLIDKKENKIYKRIPELAHITAVLSPNKKILVTSSYEGIKIIDALNLEPILEFTEFPDDEYNFYEFVFFKDSNRILLGGESRNIYIFNVSENRIIKRIIYNCEDSELENFSIYKLSLSYDEKLVFMISSLGIQLFDVASGKIINSIKLEEPDLPIFHPKLNEYLISDIVAGLIKIYNKDDNTLLRTINIDSEVEDHFAFNINFNPDGTILSVRYINKILLFNYSNGVLMQRIETKHTNEEIIGGVLKMEANTLDQGNTLFDEDGITIHHIAWKGYILSFDIRTGKLINSFLNIRGVEGADFSNSIGLDDELAKQLIRNGAIINN